MNTKILFLAIIMGFALQTYAQRVDMSLIPYRQGDLWGFATPDNKIAIAPKYAEASWFSEGYAVVKLGKKYGYINKVGKMVIPAKYTVAKPFQRGFMMDERKNKVDSVLFAGASLRSDGYEICINTRGVRMPKCPAIAETVMKDNNIPVRSVENEKTYTVSNANGLFDKIVDDYKISNSDETFYVAIKNNRYGVFNTKFETIVPFEFDSIKLIQTKSPYLEVSKGGLYGMIDGNGQMRILPENNRIYSVHAPDGKDFIILTKAGQTYIKDSENKSLLPIGYSDIVYDGKTGFILTGNDNFRGYFYTDRRMVLPKYTDIKVVPVSDYLLVKTFNGKIGYINSNGKEYFVE